MKCAGGRDMDTAKTKGIRVQGDMGARKQQAAAQSSSQFKYTTDEELIDRVRQRIKSRGARGILGIGKSFKIMDDDGSGALDINEFAKALSSYRISTD